MKMSPELSTATPSGLSSPEPTRLPGEPSIGALSTRLAWVSAMRRSAPSTATPSGPANPEARVVWLWSGLTSTTRAGRQVVARPVGAVARLARASRRRPLVASLMTLLLVSLVGGVAGVTWKWLEANTNARKATDKAQEAQFQE